MGATDHDPTTSLPQIAARFGLADIYVFGSRADEIDARLSKGEASSPRAGSGSGTDSDVDIGVRPLRGHILSPPDRADLALALERALNVKQVDLVLVTEASAFLALAVIRGNLLYCADARDQAEYELYILRRAGDLAPLERERQQIVLGGGR